MTFFGFAINTGASEKAAFSLYTTDSSLAFIISHLGILGLITLFLLTFYLIRLIIPLKFFIGIYLGKDSPKYYFFLCFIFIMYNLIALILDPTLLEPKLLFLFGLNYSALIYNRTNFLKI